MVRFTPPREGTFIDHTQALSSSPMRMSDSVVMNGERTPSGHGVDGHDVTAQLPLPEGTSGTRADHASSLRGGHVEPQQADGDGEESAVLVVRQPTIRTWALAPLLVLAGSAAHPALGAQGAPAPLQHAQASPDRARQEARRPARLTVSVPHDDTVLSLDGQAIVGAGTTRVVETPPLRPRERRRFTLTASWNPNTYTTMTRTKSGRLEARQDRHSGEPRRRRDLRSAPLDVHRGGEAEGAGQ